MGVPVAARSQEASHPVAVDLVGASGQVAKFAVASNHSEERYDAVFERVLPRVWETEISILNEAAAAQNLLEGLLRHPHERRMLIVRNSGRFQSLALCEAILESAQGGGKANSDEALDLVDLAIVLADSLAASRLRYVAQVERITCLCC